MKLSRFFVSVIFIWCSFSITGCSDNEPKLSPLSSDSVILAYGDSLTFGYGANSETESYPAILEKLTDLKVINSGIPGEVSQQGLARLPAVLAETKPNLVILCHGGNDLIRKLDNQQLKSNLDQMIKLIQQSGAEVMLIAVPRFSVLLGVPELYVELATSHEIPIELTIISELERDASLKSDTIHPNAVGYKILAEHVYSLLLSSGGI